MNEQEVRAVLEELGRLPTPRDAAGFEVRHESRFDLQCRLADLLGKPRPEWPLKGIL